MLKYDNNARFGPCDVLIVKKFACQK